MKLVVLGLSITSSWGNGHATTFRALLREFAARGHQVLFLERDAPWYSENRDLTDCPYAEVQLYHSLAELKREFSEEVFYADAVIVGSYVPEGIAVGEWVTRTAGGITAFYDIDTPVTLARLERDDCDYLSRALVPRYHLYLSFAGGPTLQRLEHDFGSPCARPLYCAVDEQAYYPERTEKKWELGYLGTYSVDRQPMLDRLLLEPARRWPEGRFVVAGPQYPADIPWPPNVERIEHLPPAAHCAFYNAQQFTLNVTRADMVVAGYAPSVRLFEAAACGTAIISDYWAGLEEFFALGTELLVVHSCDDVRKILKMVPPEEAAGIGRAGRASVLSRHTARHRAAELEGYLQAQHLAIPSTADHERFIHRNREIS